MNADYRELTAAKPEARSISDMQRARRLANESLPSTEWTMKRDALRACGLVQERREMHRA